MMTESFKGFGRASGAMVALAIVLVTALMGPATAWAQQPEPAAPAAQAAAPEGERRGGEANLVLPDLNQVPVGGYQGRTPAHDRPRASPRSASCSGWSSSTS